MHPHLNQSEPFSNCTETPASVSCAAKGHLMPERCKQCEKYEKNLKDLRERRRNLWRRGELTDAIAEELSSKEQRIIGELKEHQATQHKHSTPL